MSEDAVTSHNCCELQVFPAADAVTWVGINLCGVIFINGVIERDLDLHI